jgi:Uma2 family endonuclease
VVLSDDLAYARWKNSVKSISGLKNFDIIWVGQNEDFKMDWHEVCEHPELKDLPFKIELNEHGKVIMTPVKVNNSAYQGEIEFYLRLELKTGRTLPECAIKTSSGTKVADVAWISDEKFAIVRDQAECSVAPEICVEVLSAGNTAEEMSDKKRLYFESGALEFWLCSDSGKMTFFDHTGPIGRSQLVNNFPAQIDLS